VARVATTVLVLALLAGTAVAFAVTETLKTQPTPILGTKVDKIFSPECRCDDPVANISFRVRERDRVSAVIVDRDDDVVRHLGEETTRPGQTVEFVWDGLTDDGGIVPDGTYRPRVHLADARRTILLPNPILLDQTAPELELVSVVPQTFSPDGDGRRDRIVATYRANERVRAELYVNARRRVRSKFLRDEGTLEWYGKVRGRSVPRGTYRLSVAGVDRAGNPSRRTGEYFAHVRYVSVAPKLKLVRPAQRFGIRVATDASSYRWRFARARGVASGRRLVLRAPRRPGFYTLYVDVNGHATKATIAVRRPAR
jgi:flagellar hook assembly protein FlgD